MADVKEIVGDLRAAISAGGLTERKVDEAIHQLSKIAAYDDEKFPALPSVEFTDTSGSAPQTLAEALLWKLGHWKKYKKFAANYEAQDLRPTKKGVVLYAFVKHLKDRSVPIYDQHAIRALWAIDPGMRKHENNLRALLFKRSGKWRETGSGKHTKACYDLFLERIPKILAKTNAPSLDKLDRLLMPLGQSIKRATKKAPNDFGAFSEMLGDP
jgi:hypothetical protein